jgi:hypothetical protein
MELPFDLVRPCSPQAAQDRLFLSVRVCAAPNPGPPPIISIIPYFFCMFNKNFATKKHKRLATNPTSLKLRRVNEPGRRQKVYKYMRIYLWSALRTMVLRMRGLRKRDLIADLHCLLTRQEDGGQVGRQAVKAFGQPSGSPLRSGRDGVRKHISVCVYTYGVCQEESFL